ncbi:ROK family protein [Paenibacillus rhizovicinus]|uniref:ROK family protein n=1 Tax=Paenibacillus rhizovicinus TaxID=2704463 RepID=A0A6C0P533_9BACL|nr:ROK family protein [Paenibacillus rhizovicinus]QHW33451.1 ROK family protein [Paenibacillus rhizovicinus]
MMRDVYAGIDIGGTNTVVGLFNEQMKLVMKSSFATAKPDRITGAAPMLDRLADEVRRLADDRSAGGRLRRVGIGVPGQIDAVHGIVREASNLGWHDVHLAAEMKKRLNVPVAIEHDVRSYAKGEAAGGAGKGCRNLICLTIGTGIAAAIMADGAMVRGANGLAGEFGHDIVDGETAPCSCGKSGCLETIASATGIARLAEELVLAGRIPDLAARSGSITAQEVYQACMRGDKDARTLFERVGTLIGRKLAGLVYALDPEMIIVGGGVAAAGDLLLEPIRQELGRHCPHQASYLKVSAAQLGDEAGLIGALHTGLAGDERVDM